MIHRTMYAGALGALMLIFVAAGCARDGARPGGVPALAPTGTVVPEDSQPIPWTRYFQALDKKAKEENRAILLYFVSDPCTPCQMMDEWTFSDKRVVRALKDFVPVRIRGDVEMQPARQFGVKAFPTVIFFTPKDGEIDRKTGFRDAEAMLRWIEKVNKNKSTIAAFRERLEQDPDDLEALIGQAQNFLDAGRDDDAFDLAERAEKIAPEDASVLAIIGLCHLKKGEIEEAEAAIDAAFEADEHNELARKTKIGFLLGKADTALLSGKAEESMIPLKEVLRLEPESFEALIEASRALFKLNDPDSAREMLKKASRIRPSSPLPYEGLGDFYQRTGDEAQAEREFLKAIEVEPRYEPPYYHLIEMYEKQGKRAEMMAMYSKVLLFDPAGAHNEIAWMMATSEHPDIRDAEAAIKNATIAIELEPRTWYIDTLAEAYYALGHYKTAIAIIKEAIAQKPDDMKYYEDQLAKFQNAMTAAEKGKID